ncbi:hypothetical protein ACJ41O_004611 [Fusarium nematophilum]
MLPPKFGSARYKNFPSERRASLRNDVSLVALRYEKTVPAEPPIPIVSRNPARPSRRPSSSSASSHSSYHRPVVVPPPGSVAPPTEEHPALRGSASSSPSPRTSPISVEEWKRDSGVARANSTSTIHEEEEEGEDDCMGSLCSKSCESVTKIPVVSSSVSSLVSSVVSRPGTTVQHMEDPFIDENSITAPITSVSSAASSVVSNAPCTTTTPPPPSASHSDPVTPTRASRAAPIPIPFSRSKSPKIPSSPSCPVASSPPSPSSSPRSSFSASPRKLVKSLSLRTGSRFGTKSLSQVFTAPMQPLWRGSSTPASSSSSSSSTPTTSTTAAPGTTSSATANATATAAAVASPKQALSSSPKPVSRFWHRPRSASTTTSSTTTSAGTILTDCDLPFFPLDVSIPCDSLLEDGFMNSVTFSKRGSIMFGSRDVAALDGALDQKKTPLDYLASENPNAPTTPNNEDNDDGRTTPTPTTTTAAPTITPTPTTPTRATTPTTPVSQSLPRPSDESNDMNTSNRTAGAGSPRGRLSPPDIRVLAADVEKESQKVRSLYTVGDGSRGEPGKRRSYCERLEPTPEVPSEENELDPARVHLSPAWQTPASGSSFSPRFEMAGGLEDWDELDGAHVDRYGFITLPPPAGSRIGTPTETRSASGSPRKRNVLQKRDLSSLSSPLSGGRRTPTRKVSARSLNTQTSELSLSTSLRSSRSVIRQASNLLPHNRDRRWMDEAGDMLNTTPSLQDIVDEIQAERLTEAVKRKEWERSEKWRKMAKVVRRGGEGEGMEFEFDVKNPKLVERTWKGIPDRWRGAAWWSFMATSAQEHKFSATEDKIVAEFHRLQLRSSPDDVQIDLDVPRTISRHIMFRRRYRGGQRLLFRVLHAISIYFPETGYVQGMASLAATLLCYFDEEKCFVMLVRMWQLRGLARLYRPGFEELMAAMSDFNNNWLNKEVANKLVTMHRHHSVRDALVPDSV